MSVSEVTTGTQWGGGGSRLYEQAESGGERGLGEFLDRACKCLRLWGWPRINICCGNRNCCWAPAQDRLGAYIVVGMLGC